MALVCHSPGLLHRVTYKGAPIVKGKPVTGFANSEEDIFSRRKMIFGTYFPAGLVLLISAYLFKEEF
jgi:hypothetical protein